MALEDPAPTDPVRLAALEDRYADQAKPLGIAWNETIATLFAHRSVRSYLPRPLPDGTIETLPATGWSAAVLARTADAAALGGRNRLREALANRGLPLR